MKFIDQIVVNRKIESVFAWLAQPEHLVQVITLGPAGQKISNDSLPPPSSQGSSSSRPPLQPEVEIHNLTAIPLRVGATFQFVIRIKVSSQEWRTFHSGSVEMTEYMPPHSLGFKSHRKKYPPVDYRMTLYSEQERTSITCVAMTHPGWRGLLYLLPVFTSLAKTLLAGQMHMLKEQLEREIE
ncbi:MAG: hypothetical protein ACJ8BW_34680 [Ktedonobacteraceae bacterium]